MIIWLDDEYKCHVVNNDTFRAIETEYFNGFCTEYIEGHRFVPEGETWINAEGNAFEGEMVAAWIDFNVLDDAQRAYEQEELRRLKAENAEYEAALSEIEEALGVTK